MRLNVQSIRLLFVITLQLGRIVSDDEDTFSARTRKIGTIGERKAWLCAMV